MKNLFLFFFSIASSIVFSQQKAETIAKPKVLTKDNVTAPVYFGCEDYPQDKTMVSCLSQKLSEDIQSQISFFSNIADYLHIETAQSKLGFKINKDGNFGDVSTDGSNPIFNSVALSSLVLLNNKMERANLKITPAKGVDGKAVAMKYTMPLRYESAEKNNDFEKFPSENRVLFTLKTDEETIEVRIDKEFNLTTFGNNGSREYYLGKFSNLFEMASIDPYATAFDSAFKSGAIDITKGKIDDKEYKLQIKNFFENDPSVQVLITVVREENGTWAEYYEYKTKKEFNQSKFASLTYR
ncbi:MULTISPECIES: hypothetical protein [unclassified Empedobacter]|uniref:hypothetical protein n=1 Tax=unclassified Empedobacter TaxID=2643773 RepID=UPI0025BCEBCE|nr:MULTISPECIES: hypothetical protein [unclassified Empedobacter]